MNHTQPGHTQSPQATAAPAPLLRLRGVVREYPAGDDAVVAVLKDVDLDIHAGEMLAIVGPSGSGKSTLMNILGCLDKPTRGSYAVCGKQTAQMMPDELAQLRREHFGFIFQRYHLMGDLSALGNTEMPAIYAGMPAAQRHARAQQLLVRLGLQERLQHKPGQLSGGQQQRVSIARALMNGGDVILADEPTGALDQASGHEVMHILKQLNAQGHTIILVTHDAQVASHARRIIEISDGRIVSDRAHDAAAPQQQQAKDTLPPQAQRRAALPLGGHGAAARDRLREAAHMALRAMVGHKLRTLLTTLGIIIGIASVVSVVALGEGSRRKILADINAMGTNTIDIYPGSGFGERRMGPVRTLRPADAQALAQLSYVDSVSPNVGTARTVRRGNVDKTAEISGVGEGFFRVRGYHFAAGNAFDAEGVLRQSQDAVIDPNTQDAFFAPHENPIGQVLLIGGVPVRVIGVTAKREGMFMSADALNIWLPYTTVLGRIAGRDHLRSITVRIKDKADSAAAEEGIAQLLRQRHGTQDFFTQSSESIREMVDKTTATMTLLVSAIAVISLVVGGIGVMNIMLVSVTERTQEIGVRMAVGARRSDILQQFLIEAVLVCLTGGVLGVALSLLLGLLFDQISAGDFRMVFSIGSIVAAFACSTLIGLLFGFLPARNAARLNPVDALSRQ